MALARKLRQIRKAPKEGTQSTDSLQMNSSHCSKNFTYIISFNSHNTSVKYDSCFYFVMLNEKYHQSPELSRERIFSSTAQHCSLLILGEDGRGSLAKGMEDKWLQEVKLTPREKNRVVGSRGRRWR